MPLLRPRPATPPEVLPMREARRTLPEMSRCFAEKGVNAEPVFFGAHRRPAGVMLSYERYINLLDMLDDLASLAEIRRRDRADDGQRMTLEELIAEQGFDPADLEPVE